MLTRRVDRVYLERYKKCSTSEDVAAAQEAIISELEQKYEDARKPGVYMLDEASGLTH
jgi:pre-rRNA-processing protein TSR3